MSSTEVVLITSNTLDIESTLLLTMNGYDLKNEDVPELSLIIGTDPFNKLKNVKSSLFELEQVTLDNVVGILGYRVYSFEWVQLRNGISVSQIYARVLHSKRCKPQKIPMKYNNKM